MKRNAREVYKLIEEKIENAENDIECEKRKEEKDNLKILQLQAQALAYYDVSILLQSSGVLLDSDRLIKLEKYLDKWSEQLAISGVNSKSMVRNDIQYLIKERLNDSN